MLITEQVRSPWCGFLTRTARRSMTATWPSSRTSAPSLWARRGRSSRSRNLWNLLCRTSLFFQLQHPHESSYDVVSTMQCYIEFFLLKWKLEISIGKLQYNWFNFLDVTDLCDNIFIRHHQFQLSVILEPNIFALILVFSGATLFHVFCLNLMVMKGTSCLQQLSLEIMNFSVGLYEIFRLINPIFCDIVL